MFLLHYYLLLAQAVIALATPHLPRISTNQTQGIQWAPCEILNQTMPILCGTLAVPLDYMASNSSKTINLNLYKVAATEQPTQGSILLNFGGPGISSAHNLAMAAELLNRYTGGSFDIISLDPRGTVPETLPFSCFNTPEERAAWDLLHPTCGWNASDTALGDDWANAELRTETCKSNTNVTSYGSYIGTAYTARDYMSVVDNLGEDGLLRYWGISYGSALGATIAAMFPDRIDRLIIDGVLNIHEYWRDYDIEKYHDTDKAFSAFLEACFDASEHACVLARPNTTASAFEEHFYQWLEDFKYHPFAGPDRIIDYTLVKSWVLMELYSPAHFPRLATFLDAVMRGEFPVGLDMDSLSTAGEVAYGIECADKTARADRVEDVFPALEKQNQLSRVAGDTPAGFIMTCAQWPVESKERYLGDFNVQTRNPLLVIGNTYDPITPFKSAKNASDSIPGSVVLEQRGFGHSSMAQISVCTMKVIQEYFVNGKLPEPGTVCEVDQPLFSNVTWKDVLPETLS